MPPMKLALSICKGAGEFCARTGAWLTLLMLQAVNKPSIRPLPRLTVFYAYASKPFWLCLWLSSPATPMPYNRRLTVLLYWINPMLLAAVIFVLTLTFVIWQPKGLGIGYSALIGAAGALAAGVVLAADVDLVCDIVWDATLTFMAVMMSSLILDEAGILACAALHVSRAAKGNGRVLFPSVIILGAFNTAFSANDAAAL